MIFRQPVPAVIHRAAHVEQQRGAEVRFLLVFSNVKAVRTAENAPVDVPDFVAGNVLAVLLELDAEALVGRAVHAGAEAFDDLPGDNLEVADLLEISWRKKIRDVCHLKQF